MASGYTLSVSQKRSKNRESQFFHSFLSPIFRPHWQCVYVAVVNRVGCETGNIRGKSAPGQGLEFWGASFFCDPFGQVSAEVSHDREEILMGDVDLNALEDIRRNWPFLRDRIDAYAPITNRLLDGR